MDLNSLRNRIDNIDAQILDLMRQRLTVVDEVTNYKKENQIPTYDAIREREKINTLADICEIDMRSYARSLYGLLFDISKDYQLKKQGGKSGTLALIQKAISQTPNLFPPEANVICQGTWGAYGQEACDALFSQPKIMFAKTFEGVFSAIDNGLGQYGLVPLENSTAGSVNQVYELMDRYNFHIVRAVRLKIDHHLLAPKAVSKKDIKEIVSHEQALAQCEKYLKQFPNVKITICENTAAAAAMVAEANRDDLAALASAACADFYELNILESSVQDSDNNYTRFICIAKNIEIYPGADITSLMLKISHKPGALYKILSRFFTLNVNLIKLESRPIPGRDFEFRFYFDLDISVYSESFLQLMSELESISEDFRYLGSYSETN